MYLRYWCGIGLTTEKEHSLASRAAHSFDRLSGKPIAFATACIIVVAWLASGPFFAWSSSWQSIIGTGCSVVTFLMVFVIQHTQRRDTQAIQLKLDELIRVDRQARNELIRLEAKPEHEVEAVRSAFGAAHRD